MKRTIWILNHYAKASGHRHSEIAIALAKRGTNVVVIASSYLHGVSKYATEEKLRIEEIAPNYFFVQVRTNPPYHGNGIKRILNMFSYAINSVRAADTLAELCGKPAIVIGSSVHPLAWEAASHIADRFKARYVAEVRDLWPLSLIEVQHTSPKSPAVKFFGYLERRAYHKSYRILTSLPNAVEYICNTYPDIDKERVIWVPNALNTEIADQTDKALPAELEEFLKAHWCCIYAGSLVDSECIPLMVEAVSRLHDKGKGDIYFAIVGAGRDEEKIRKLISDKKADYIRMFPRIEKQQVMKALKSADACLAAIHNKPIYKYGLSMNKINDYLYSGTPTVFACDAPNMISQREGIGITVASDDPEAYAAAIMKVFNMPKEKSAAMGAKAREVIKTDYSYELLADRYESLLKD